MFKSVEELLMNDDSDFEIFGAEDIDDEPDEVDLDLQSLDEELDDDLAEAEYGYAPRRRGSHYGRYGEAAGSRNHPGWHVVAVNKDKLADLLVYPRAAAVPDVFSRASDDLATHIDDEIADDGRGSGLPNTLPEQVEVIKSIVAAAAFGEDLDSLDRIQSAIASEDTLGAQIRAAFESSDEAVWDWFTDDLYNMLVGVLPGTEQTMLNMQAVMLLVADAVGIPIFEQIIEAAKADGAIIISPSVYHNPEAVAPAPAPIAVVETGAMVATEVAPPRAGMSLPEPKYWLLAGYGAMTLPVLWGLKR